MTKKLLFIVFVLAFGFLSYFLLPANKKIASKKQTIEQSPESKKDDTNQFFRETSLDGTVYRYGYTKVQDNVILVPNFENRLTSSEIINKFSCDYGINGGFYTQSNKPLGLFYTENNFYGQNIVSNTFNAYFAKNTTDMKLRILSNIDEENIESSFEFIFQSGPLFDISSDFSFNFGDKQFARRSILARDVDNNFYFFTIFDKESRFSGPRLEDIPEIFKSTDMQTIANFVEILNLDGGSASAFYDKSTNTKINEITQIGSFLCAIKQ